MKNDITDKNEEQRVKPSLASSSENAVDLDPITGKGDVKHDNVAEKPGSDLAVKKSPDGKKRKLVIGAIVAVLVVIAAVSVYLLAFNKPSEKKSDDPLAAAAKFDSPRALIDAVEPDLSGKTVNVDYSDGVGAIDKDGFGVYSAPAYKTAGKDFANLPEKIEGTGYVGDSVAAEANYKALDDFFRENKFHKIRSSSGNVGSISANHTSTYSSYAEYESTNIVCAIRHVDATDSSLKNHIASVGCGDKQSYKAAAEKLQPFYAAYAGETDVKEGLVFGIIEESKIEGYERALVYQEDASQFTDDEEVRSFYGLYYKAAAGDSWKYFSGILTDETILCSEFGTDTLVKAFAGVDCYDDKAKQTTTVGRI